MKRDVVKEKLSSKLTMKAITTIFSALNVSRTKYYRWIKESVKALQILGNAIIELSE